MPRRFRLLVSVVAQQRAAWTKSLAIVTAKLLNVVLDWRTGNSSRFNGTDDLDSSTGTGTGTGSLRRRHLHENYVMEGQVINDDEGQQPQQQQQPHFRPPLQLLLLLLLFVAACSLQLQMMSLMPSRETAVLNTSLFAFRHWGRPTVATILVPATPVDSFEAIVLPESSLLLEPIRATIPPPDRLPSVSGAYPQISPTHIEIRRADSTPQQQQQQQQQEQMAKHQPKHRQYRPEEAGDGKREEDDGRFFPEQVAFAVPSKHDGSDDQAVEAEAAAVAASAAAAIIPTKSAAASQMEVGAQPVGQTSRRSQNHQSGPPKAGRRDIKGRPVAWVDIAVLLASETLVVTAAAWTSPVTWMAVVGRRRQMGALLRMALRHVFWTGGRALVRRSASFLSSLRRDVVMQLPSRGGLSPSISMDGGPGVGGGFHHDQEIATINAAGDGRTANPHTGGSFVRTLLLGIRRRLLGALDRGGWIHILLANDYAFAMACLARALHWQRHGSSASLGRIRPSGIDVTETDGDLITSSETEDGWSGATAEPSKRPIVAVSWPPRQISNSSSKAVAFG